MESGSTLFQESGAIKREIEDPEFGDDVDCPMKRPRTASNASDSSTNSLNSFNFQANRLFQLCQLVINQPQVAQQVISDWESPLYPDMLKMSSYEKKSVTDDGSLLTTLALYVDHSMNEQLRLECEVAKLRRIVEQKDRKTTKVIVQHVYVPAQNCHNTPSTSMAPTDRRVSPQLPQQLRSELPQLPDAKDIQQLSPENIAQTTCTCEKKECAESRRATASRTRTRQTQLRTPMLTTPTTQ